MKHKINKDVLKAYIYERGLTMASASRLVDMNSKYFDRIMSPEREYFTEKTISKIVSLGISRARLLNLNATIDTASGKVLLKPNIDIPQKASSFITPGNYSEEIQNLAIAINDDGERLTFDERMERLRSTNTTATATVSRFETDEQLEPISKPDYESAYQDLVSYILYIFRKEPTSIDIRLLSKIQRIDKNLRAQKAL